MAGAYALVAAAGASTRMGHPKALLPWGMGTLLRYQLAQLRLAGVEGSVVVVGSEPLMVAEIAARSGAAVVVNEQWAEGRASSIRAGADVIPDTATVVVVLGVDQPRPAAVTRALLDAYDEQPSLIVVPVRGGRRGHPVLFAGSLLGELRAVRDEEQGLRAVMARYAGGVREVEIDSPLIHIDVNTPEEYEEAVRLFDASATEETRA